MSLLIFEDAFISQLGLWLVFNIILITVDYLWDKDRQYFPYIKTIVCHCVRYVTTWIVLLAFVYLMFKCCHEQKEELPLTTFFTYQFCFIVFNYTLHYFTRLWLSEVYFGDEAYTGKRTALDKVTTTQYITTLIITFSEWCLCQYLYIYVFKFPISMDMNFSWFSFTAWFQFSTNFGRRFIWFLARLRTSWTIMT
eukprot:UN24032